MRIILISLITPSSENIRGTSALPYHLIKGSLINGNVNANDNLSFTIYSFNANGLSDEKIREVEKELGVIIKVIPLPKWYQWMFKLHLLFLRVFLKYPLGNYISLPKQYEEEIKAQKTDLIWVMGEELSRIVKQFPNHQRIQIGPDTESLYYYRMMGRRFVMNNAINYWKCALMYRKYARIEREFCTDENFTYYAVGEEDVRHLQQLNPKVKAKFLRHPHYEVRQHFLNDNDNLNANFSKPKIKLLIAGRYDLYMRQSADELIAHLNDNVNLNPNLIFLKERYTLTFLGKGWEKHVEALRSAGLEVEHIKFAPDYIEEITKHDIQITPIAIGTGTKGKVLDALANGLLVIGTPYAMENIAVENGVSCIEYREPKEVMDVLSDIITNREKYEAMAQAGREAVLKYHDRRLLAKELFGLSLPINL